MWRRRAPVPDEPQFKAQAALTRTVTMLLAFEQLACAWCCSRTSKDYDDLRATTASH
jgi:hypothetical protein